MTVIPRPLPTRFSGNRGPGGLGRGPGNGGNRPPGRIPPSGVPVWTPTPPAAAPVAAAVVRVPPPLQVAALVGAFAVGYTIGSALLQIWGLLNARPTPAPTTPLVGFTATGLIGANGGSVRVHITATQLQRSCTIDSSTQCYGPSITSTQSSVVNSYTGGGGDYIATQLGAFRVCGYNTVSAQLAKSGSGTLPPITASFISSGGVMPACGDIVSYSVQLEYTNPSGATRAPVLPTVPTELPQGWNPPKVELEARPLEVPQLLPAVAPLPALVPGAEPVAQPPLSAPGTTTRPVPPPIRWAPATPQAPANAQQINNGQAVPLPQQASPSPTPTDVHYPWPGGPGVGPGGTRPDIAAVAQEVGRIEQKLALMPRPGQDPGNPIDWGDIAATLLRIWEAIQATNAEGIYTLSSPCVLDEETDERIVTEVEYDGGLTWLEVLNNKVDALAQLQQVAKDLKQPICRHKAEGQPVTVTFTQQ